MKYANDCRLLPKLFYTFDLVKLLDGDVAQW